MAGSAGDSAGCSRRRVSATFASPPSGPPGCQPADLADGFIRQTSATMVAGVRDKAVRARLTDADAFDAGIRALLRTTEPDGVFCYTFFKAMGFRP